jgi:hypothetical protein
MTEVRPLVAGLLLIFAGIPPLATYGPQSFGLVSVPLFGTGAVIAYAGYAA